MQSVDNFNFYFKTLALIYDINPLFIEKYHHLKGADNLIKQAIIKHPKYKNQIIDLYQFEKQIMQTVIHQLKAYPKDKEKEEEIIIQQLLQMPYEDLLQFEYQYNIDCKRLKTKWYWMKVFDVEERGEDIELTLKDIYTAKPKTIETVVKPTYFRYRFPYKLHTLTANQQHVLQCFNHHANGQEALNAFQALFDIETEEDIERIKKVFIKYLRVFISFGILRCEVKP